MYDLRRFALADMTECGAALRNLGMGATCMEEVADRIVQFLYTRLVDRRMGQNGCALVRFFKTHSYGGLDSDLQLFARRSLGRAPSSAGMKCLTLLATAGDRAEWNARERSQRYRAIPLAGGQFSEQFPMFAQLFEELGVPLEVQGPPDYDLFMDEDAKADKVFYVGNAAGNPVVPAQEQFVIPFGIRSVVGFGGLLPSGHLFAVVLFSKVSISRETADLFRTLALSAKSAILPFDGKVFRTEVTTTVSDVAAESQVRTLLEQRAQVETLEQLLTNQEQAVIAHFTPRRRAQERWSGDPREQALPCIRDAMLLVDARNRIVYWNRAARAMFGYSIGEILGRPVATVLPDAFPAACERIAAHDNPEDKNIAGATFESCGLKKDGTAIAVELTVAAWKREEGSLTCIVRDITERKRAEEAFLGSEQRFRSLVENARDIIFSLSADGILTSLNPAFEAVTRWPGDTWLGKSFALLLHDDDRTLAIELCRHIIEKQVSLASTLRIRTKERGFITAEWVGVPQTEAGRVVGIFGIVRDITERKVMENAVRESEERLRSIVQSTRDAIITIDGDGKIVFWNRGAEDMFGYSAADMVGNPVTLIIPERFREAHVSGLAPTSEAGRALSNSMFELVGLKKDGSEFPVEFTLAAWQAKSHTFFTGILRDITERKQAELQLQSTLQRVRTLSRRLGVIQEEERARIARELHDQLGVELTCLKIDLSRLNSLLGNGKPAGRRRSDEKPARRKVDQKVRSMTEQIDAIIQTVQRIVRELRPGMLDDLGLAAAIEWLAEDFQRRTGIACTCQIGKDELRVDPGRATVVFRICQEALTNVARHARATAVAVRVEERHNGLVLEVQDNGCGIPAGKLSSPHSLGLLGMRERADLFGGEVSVSGHRGKGTTVVLHLPCGVSDRDEVDHVASAGRG